MRRIGRALEFYARLLIGAIADYRSTQAKVASWAAVLSPIALRYLGAEIPRGKAVIGALSVWLGPGVLVWVVLRVLWLNYRRHEDLQHQVDQRKDAKRFLRHLERLHNYGVLRLRDGIRPAGPGAITPPHTPFSDDECEEWLRDYERWKCACSKLFATHDLRHHMDTLGPYGRPQAVPASVPRSLQASYGATLERLDRIRETMRRLDEHVGWRALSSNATARPAE